MKLDDIIIGMEVVPHSKNPNKNGRIGLENSIIWKKAVEEKRPWLYVTEINNDGECVLSELCNKYSGDYFHCTDFEKYIK